MSADRGGNRGHGWRTAAGCLAGLAVAAALAAEGDDVASADRGPIEQAVIAPLAPHSLLLDVATAGDRLVAVGERGHVLYSDDGGRSWTQVPVPTRATLTGVHFEGADAGWAVGHDAVILRTLDGGLSWERVQYAPREEFPRVLLDVWFESREHGFAIGAYGYFLGDGG